MRLLAILVFGLSLCAYGPAMGQSVGFPTDGGRRVNTKECLRVSKSENAVLVRETNVQSDKLTGKTSSRIWLNFNNSELDGWPTMFMLQFNGMEFGESAEVLSGEKLFAVQCVKFWPLGTPDEAKMTREDAIREVEKVAPRFGELLELFGD